MSIIYSELAKLTISVAILLFIAIVFVYFLFPILYFDSIPVLINVPDKSNSISGLVSGLSIKRYKS